MLPIRKIIFSNLRQRTFKLLSDTKQPCYSSILRTIATSNTLYDETPLKMPSLSPTMTAGTIIKWYKKPGDKISAGDVLCEIQTDKAVMTFESDEDAVMAKIVIPEGASDIPVGQLIAIICGEEDEWRNVQTPNSENVSVFSPSPSSSAQEKPVSIGGRVAPSARNLAQKFGIDYTKLIPSGNRGFLSKEDVLAFVAANKLESKLKDNDIPSPSHQAPSSSKKGASASSHINKVDYVDLEISSIRRTIAKRLTESKSQTPHSYMSMRIDMNVVNNIRSSFKSMNIKASVNDILVKAVGIALKQVPEMNCRWNAQTQQAELVQNVDVSVAVATPTGLITPIIFNANRLSLSEINVTSSVLIAKAKDGKLQPNEFMGGTFSISNLGMFGIDYFTAVINPPQAAILAVGRTKQYFNENLELKSRMTVQLSFDARAIEEETAAKFLETVRDNLNSPFNLFESDGTSKRRLQALIG